MAALALIETPLSPARRELKSLGEQLAAAKANLAAAQAPVDRLLQAIGEHQQAEAERVDLRQAHDRALGEWLASGDGPRPEPATELLAAEHRVRETRVTAAAAEQRLADSQRAVDERNARLGSLATQNADQ
jgi:phage-related tail protein